MRKTSFAKKYVLAASIALVVVVLGYVAYRFFINDEGLNAKEKEKDKVKKYKEYIVKHRNALNELIIKYNAKAQTTENKEVLKGATDFAFEDDIEKINDPNTLLDIRNKVIRAEDFMKKNLNLITLPATQAAQTVAQPAKTQQTKTVAQTQVMRGSNYGSYNFGDTNRVFIPDDGNIKLFVDNKDTEQKMTAQQIANQCQSLQNYVAIKSYKDGQPVYFCLNDYQRTDNNEVTYSATTLSTATDCSNILQKTRTDASPHSYYYCEPKIVTF
jgi:hypothetical protein